MVGRTVVVALTLGLAACSAEPAEEADGSSRSDVETADDVAAGEGLGEPGDDVDDAATAPRGGPITLVVSGASVVTERVCDLDGDGIGDNAVAELGAESSTLFGMAMDSLIRITLEGGGTRTGGHVPWVEDVTVPHDDDVAMALFNADDDDEPDDPEDDVLGSEGFFVHPSSLDACGEPRYGFPHVVIDAGQLSAAEGTLPVPLGYDFPVRGARMSGSVEPAGTEAEILVCGHTLVHDIGGMAGYAEGDDLTALETILAGGAALGFPMLPGLTPDVDLDGDGLERFVLDDEGRLESCVDGDLTEIVGRDCWSDDRMADGLSLTVRMEAVSARFLGRYPGWEEEIEGECLEPPAESFFDLP